MTFFELAILAATCLITDHAAHTACFVPTVQPMVAAAESIAPVRTGSSVDVVLTAQSALVWDLDSGQTLYEKNAAAKRPIASISKLLSALVIRDSLSLPASLAITEDVLAPQRQGANIRLPVGQHASVEQLLQAGLIASANDAMVALAVGVAGSEEAFAALANEYARQQGIMHTRLSNATGLDGGEQYSTALDVKELMSRAFADPFLRQVLASERGELVTDEGVRRTYTTTNDLAGTYLTVLAAKTGYTLEAGENLVLVTQTADGHRLGAVVLGSAARFQDMKALVEWIQRNYTWQ